MGPIFNDQRPNETLDEFLERKVRPTSEEMESLREDVHAFVLFLQQELPFGNITVAEVIKAGSLGKGTAVRAMSDIDLVVYINGVTSINALCGKRSTVIHSLIQKVDAYTEWRGRIRSKKNNGKYPSSKYSMSYVLDGHEVDILPAFDILKRYRDPRSVYNQMVPPSKRNRNTKAGRRRWNQQGNKYSASLAPLQVQFTGSADSRVKDVIRLLKYWKKEKAPDFRNYCLELLAIHASRQHGWTSTEDLFKRVMHLLSIKSGPRVAFDDNYTSSEFTRHFPDNQPYILDPANPFMNTLNGTALFQACRAAKETLSKIS